MGTDQRQVAGARGEPWRNGWGDSPVCGGGVLSLARRHAVAGCPERLGDGTNSHRRHSRWSANGVWENRFNL